MLAAFFGLCAALPDLIKFAQQFMDWLNKVSGNDPQGFIKKAGAVFAQVNAAQSPEERQNAAKGIADLISGL